MSLGEVDKPERSLQNQASRRTEPPPSGFEVEKGCDSDTKRTHRSAPSDGFFRVHCLAYAHTLPRRGLERSLNPLGKLCIESRHEYAHCHIV